jgi:hypothetical protein
MQQTYFLCFLLFALLPACQEAPVAEKTVENAAATPPRTPGMIHTVYFWLKPDVTAQEKQQLLDELNKLKAITSVQRAFIGPPAATEARTVVDNTYDYAFILWFEDVAAQEAYQIDPIHLAFVEKNQHLWVKVAVYDSAVL